jgi:hypothetical protein
MICDVAHKRIQGKNDLLFFSFITSFKSSFLFLLLSEQCFIYDEHFPYCISDTAQTTQ